jgi:uncharacterized protein YcfJ
MNPLPRVTLTLSALAFSTLAAAQVTFYEREDFEGQSFTTNKQVGNFERFGFNDRASSAVVAGNRWEICQDARFEGRCVVLRPGSYGSLAAMGLDNRISSVRAVSADARIEDSRYAPLPATPRITFYKNERFVGKQFTTEKQVRNFERVGFNDRASSVDVVGNRWEVCEDAGFRGKCVVLRPGRYPTLTSLGLGNNISSVRRVPGNTRIDDSRYAPAPVAAHDGRDYRRRSGERLYQANVTSSHAVIATADQRCWVEQEQVPQDKRGLSTTGAVVGALVGGFLGHQISDGKTIATVGGAAAGGALGANVNRITGSQQQAQTRDVQKCASVPSQTPTYWDVTYNFRGQDHRVQMATQPGSTVTVNEQGEPRA